MKISCMHENEICMKIKILPKDFMTENPMHEVMYSPTTHENFRGGAKFSFS